MATLEVIRISIYLPDLIRVKSSLLKEPVVIFRYDEIVARVVLLEDLL